MPRTSSSNESPLLSTSAREPIPGLETLDRALTQWLNASLGEGSPAGLRRWLAKEIDDEGVPRRLPVESWSDCLRRLVRASAHDDSWREEAGVQERITGLVRAVLRFSRPDGSPAFGPRQAVPETRREYRAWGTLAADPAVWRVVGWWFPNVAREARTFAPPPLPADVRTERPLAVLRSDWNRDGDFVAIDHRNREATGKVDLVLGGRSWLGPSWSSGLAGLPVTGARPMHGSSRATADLFEWSFRANSTRVTRTALLFRGRKLALLAEQVDGSDSQASWRIGLAPDVSAHPLADSPALSLRAEGVSGSARVIPLGLSARSRPDGQAGLRMVQDSLEIQQHDPGRRRWLPLLFSWDGLRNKKALNWRRVTVAERSRSCPPDVAFAARVAFGRDETLVVYRSLGRPALRSFLGHQTTARFLVGWFSLDGKVDPIVKVDA